MTSYLNRSPDRTKTGLVVGIYLFMLVFVALFGSMYNTTLNQVILWVMGPLVVVYVVFPRANALTRVPKEYWFYGALIIFSIIGFYKVVNIDEYFRYFKVIVSNFILMIVLYLGIRNFKDFEFVLRMLLFSVICIVISAFIVVPEIAPGQDPRMLRLAGIVGNANGMANYARMTILISLFFLSQRPRKVLKIFYFILMSISFYVILMSASRSNFANVLLVFVLFFGREYFSGMRLFVLLFMTLLLGNIVLTLAEGFLQEFYIYDRLTRNNSLEEAVEGEARIELYMIAWDQFIHNPLIGVGLNQFRYYADGKISHTDFLDILVQLGIFAGVIYMSIYIRIARRLHGLRRFWRSIGQEDLSRFLSISLLSEIIYGLANPNWFSQSQMIFLSLLIVIIRKIQPQVAQYYFGLISPKKVELSK